MGLFYNTLNTFWWRIVRFETDYSRQERRFEVESQTDERNRRSDKNSRGLSSGKKRRYRVHIYFCHVFFRLAGPYYFFFAKALYLDQNRFHPYPS